MDIVEEKNILKNEIDKVQNPDVLQQISYILSTSSESLMTEEQKAMVMESREEYFKNPSSGMSFEDFDKDIKNKYGF